MDAQRWQRISALFDRILELPDAERAAEIDLACANDPTLRVEITALLRRDAGGDGDAGAILDAPARVAADWAGEERARRGPDMTGRCIGPWRLLRELGHGGMGVVYLAERADGQFEQRAALKLIRTGDDEIGLRRRFLRERQILARLEHPDIARLLDGGIAEDGRPYFAMEYVDGQPLIDYVAEHDCDARTRLRLFADVCQAVQFAHRQLVVHRDIKPSNVLVTREGRVKLLDFGIAMLLDHSASEDTETRVHPFTPAYAAPEQLRGDVVTTSADVYALGVLLYELLCGARPYKFDEGASPLDWVRVIEGPTCVAPSIAARSFASAPDASRKRARVTPLPERTVRGDLDLIAMNALRREPERRYASAEALAADVRNYLAGRPIAARRESTRYVVGKFIRRHRVGTALAAVAALVLFAALGIALSQARRARAQAERARAAAVLAQEQTKRAEAVRGFLVGVFEQAEPDANQGQPLSAHQLLEKGEQQLGKGAEDPALEADAATLLADLYEQIGDFDRAQSLLKRALIAAAKENVPEDVKARALIVVAGVEDDNDAYDVAIGHAQEGLALLRSSTPAAAELTAKAHNILAHCLIGKGDAGEAEALLRVALKEDIAAVGERNESVAEEWVELGSVLGNAGNYVESEAAFARGIDAWRAVYGENSFHVAHALNELSNMLSDKGDYAGAEHALRQSLQIRLQTVGPLHRDTLVVEHNLLVNVELQGRIAESLDQRLKLIERTLSSPQMHPIDTGPAYVAAGKDLRDLGRIGEAQTMFRKAIAAYETGLGKGSAQSVSALRGLGTSFALEGRYPDAEATLRDALSILLQHDVPTSLGVAAVRADLGHVMRLEHRPAEARTELKQATDAFDRADSTDRARALATAERSEAELDSGDADAAHTTAETALTQARKSLPPKHYLLGMPLFALARSDLALHRDAEAETALREALAVRNPPHPADDPRVLEVEVALIDVLEAEHRSREAHALSAMIDAPLRASHTPYAADLRLRLAAGAAANGGNAGAMH